jgi:hypothetical protein
LAKKFSTTKITRQLAIGVRQPNVICYEKPLKRFKKYGNFVINTRINSGVYDKPGSTVTVLTVLTALNYQYELKLTPIASWRGFAFRRTPRNQKRHKGRLK